MNVIQPVLEEKRNALIRLYQVRPYKIQTHHAARSCAQNTTRKCVQDYWNDLCSCIETARGSGYIKEMYIKIATGPPKQTCGVMMRRDGTSIEDNKQIPDIWVKHYNNLYGTERDTCHDTLANLLNC